MALAFSTKLRNSLLGGVPARHVATYTASTIAAVDGGEGADSFTDSANGFVTAGFTVGDSILVYGFTGGMAAIHGPFVATSVAVGTIEVATGSLVTDDAGESVTLVVLTGGSLKDIFKDGVLKIYSGTRPSNADATIGGATLLVTISNAGATFVAGTVAGGIEFGASSSGAISKSSSETWQGTAVQTGTAGFFRFYANATDAGGADTDYIYPRIDGTIATSGADLNMTSTSIRSGASITVDTFTLTLPATA
ncbi:MAG: hypothetical protein BWY95_01726 [Bacteroidetes bacterium ADurb.BinA104]|nr:MAG: hypothetical protein BWY95_01726 [Bacteroidetes bacterium ADurb.BinA104]